MRIPRARVTEAVAIAIGVAWALVTIARFNGMAAIVAGFIPARFTTDLPSLIMPGLGDDGPWCVPAILTPLTTTLIHDGALHLGLNLLILVWCGRLVEASIGPRCMALLYVAGAYVAAAAQFAYDPTSTIPVVGANGAVSAVLGAYALLYNQNNVRAIGPISAPMVRALWLAAAWIGLQALLSLTYPGVAVVAQIGGFLTGLALARPLLLWRYRKA